MDHTLSEALAALTTTPHQSLKGKLITVTGAGSGIGRATAILLAGRGAIVGLADIQEGPLKEAATKITTSGGKVYTSIVNIADRSAVETWISTLVRDVGKPLDGAVNLAGIVGRSIGTPPGAVRNVSDDEFCGVMKVNVQGTLNCVRAQLNNIKTGSNGRNGGSIVNAASVAGFMGFTDNAAYVASKHAVIGITKCAAKEEGPKGIRLNCIAPGIIATPMMDRIDTIMGKDYGDPGAMARRGDPEEVAQVIGFLVGDESSFVSGMVYGIDGGWAC